MIELETKKQIQFSPLVKTYTLEEFENLPEPANHSRLELIGGILYRTPMPDWKHSQIAAELARRIESRLSNLKYPGKLFFPRSGIKTGKATWLEPDIFLLSDRMLQSLPNEHPSTAELVIEILSPSTEDYDRTVKADTYAAMRVKEYWLVDMEKKTITVYENTAGGTVWTRIVTYENGENILSKSVVGLILSVDGLWGS